MSEETLIISGVIIEKFIIFKNFLQTHLKTSLKNEQQVATQQETIREPCKGSDRQQQRIVRQSTGRKYHPGCLGGGKCASQ